MKKVGKVVQLQPKPRAGSTNFLASILTLVFLVIGFQGASIPIDAVPELVDAFTSKNIAIIMVALIPNVIVPALKIIENIRNNGFNWSFLQSTNFRAQVTAVIFLILELTGVIPVDSGKLVAGLIQGANISIHVKKDMKIAA